MIDPLSFDAITTAPLIGRATPLSAIEQLVARIEASEPGPRTLLISGEAGVGKSRMLAALRARVGATWRVLEAGCFEPYQSEPYAPLTDMLPRALAELGSNERDAVLGPTTAALAMLPGLEHLAPSNAAPAAPDTVQNQRRLFQALTECFTRLAAVRPILIVIEDIHWSDTATLAFLPLLAHALGARPALLVLTYRGDEIQPPLAAALSELDRRRLAIELALSRLSRAEVDAQLRMLLGLAHPTPAGLLDALYTLTDGNPFFVEEVVTAMLATGTIDPTNGAWLQRSIAELPIPRSVQEAVARRSAQLSPPAHELLSLAAALGRRFDFALLQRATGRAEAELIGLLKELIAARLLVEETADQFAFRHALGRAAVYGALLARERRALHRRLAEALEHAAADAHAADLAQHFFQAGMWEQALHYAQIAAEHARRLNAQREVVAHLTVALAAADHLPNMSPVDLLIERADTYSFQGDFEAARADVEAALAHAQASKQPMAEWKALLQLGTIWTARDYERAGSYFAQTLAQARALDDPTLLARSLNQVGNWHMNQDRPQTALAMHAEALAIFEDLGDLMGHAESLELLGVCHFFNADIASAEQTLERAGKYYRSIGDQQKVLRVSARKELLGFAGYEATASNSLLANLSVLEHLNQLFHQTGTRAHEAAITQVIGGNLVQIGEFGRAREYLQTSVALSEEFGYSEWQAYACSWLAHLALELYDPQEAARWAEQALTVAQSTSAPMVVREAAHQFIRVHAAQGARAEAEAMLAAVLPPSSEHAESSLMLRRVRLAGAELALAQREPGRALAEVDSLISTAINTANKVIPALWHVRGKALLALRRHEEAGIVLADAFAAACAEGRRPLASRILATRAAVALAQRRREEAETILDEAPALIDVLATSIGEPHVREQFRQRALADLPTPPTITPRQAVKQVFDGLTDRELEVARLIARGYTNRQIAESLVLSERTVTTHIGNMLSKLGFSSRAQVARWVTEKGLAR